MLKKNAFSIIIPVKAYNAFCEESLGTCARLYPGQEILFCPDQGVKTKFSSVRVIPSGPVGPSAKRDLCAGKAKGSILAFLDDDAYPAPGWLEAAEEIFRDPGVAAVGGPAVTPNHDGFWRWASGLVYSSFLVGGPYAFRYLPLAAREVDDFPSCNLLVRKEVMKAIGGFNTRYWPGEDTVACLKITHELRRKIVYDPRVLVYHHRRELYQCHLNQVRSYACHRGYFVKKFPQTSFRASYFLPSAWLLGVFLGWVPALAWRPWLNAWGGGLAAYGLLCLAEGLRSSGRAPRRLRGIKMAIQVAAGIAATHLVYGCYFLKGLFSKTLER